MFPSSFLTSLHFTSNILSKEAFFDQVMSLFLFSHYWAFFSFIALSLISYCMFICLLVYCLTSSLEYKLHKSRLFLSLCCIFSVESSIWSIADFSKCLLNEQMKCTKSLKLGWLYPGPKIFPDSQFSLFSNSFWNALFSKV